MALVLFLIVYWAIVFLFITNYVYKAAGFGIGLLIPGGGEVLIVLAFFWFVYMCYKTAGSVVNKSKTS